jgi:hypothetical protein
MFDPTIDHGVSRGVKHISVIACISATGKSLIPGIVISQNSSSIQEHMKQHGGCFGKDLILKSNQKSYLSAGIFLEDIRTVFFPYLVSLRDLAVFTEEIAVVLMENCSAHVTGDVIRLRTEARVRVITFALYMTQVLQVLDLILFGVLKRRPRSDCRFGMIMRQFSS